MMDDVPERVLEKPESVNEDFLPEIAEKLGITISMLRSQPDDVQQMIKDRKAYLKRQLTTKEGFTMERLNADYEVTVAHLWPDMPPEVWVQELMRQFVAMQWGHED